MGRGNEGLMLCFAGYAGEGCAGWEEGQDEVRWLGVGFVLGSMGWRSGAGKGNMLLIFKITYTAEFIGITVNRELALVIEIHDDA